MKCQLARTSSALHDESPKTQYIYMMYRILRFWTNRGWRLKICKIFEITRTIYSNSKRLVQFLRQNAFLTYSWRFLRSNTFRTIIKIAKNYWDEETCRKKIWFLNSKWIGIGKNIVNKALFLYDVSGNKKVIA